MIIAIEFVVIVALLIRLVIVSGKRRDAEELAGVFERASIHWMHRALKSEGIAGYVDPSHGGPGESEIVGLQSASTEEGEHQ